MATLSSTRQVKPALLSLVFTLRQGYNYYQPAACEKLLDTVHREFARRLPAHIGTMIVGSFQDELPDMPTWLDRNPYFY